MTAPGIAFERVGEGDVAFLRDLAARMFKYATPQIGFDQGDTDRLHVLANRLASTRPDAGDDAGVVERVARAIDDASVGHSINLTKMVDGETEYTAVVGNQEPQIFPSYSDASDYVEKFRSHARARAALATLQEPRA